MSGEKGISDLIKTHRITLEHLGTVKFSGIVSEVRGSLVTCEKLDAKISDICFVTLRDGRRIKGEVIGLSGNKSFLMFMDDLKGISTGDEVYTYGKCLEIKIGEDLKGKVLNAFGQPMDGQPLERVEEMREVFGSSPPVLERIMISEKSITGVKAIDGLLALGRGQRMGIFSQAGLGKSSLLGMICKNSVADVNVIALVGERGREVGEFIRDSLGNALERSIIVCSTSDDSPISRVRSAYTALTIAEYYRDKGQSVMLMVDSITRLAMAQREIGVVLGEPPVTRGYTPSVFAALSGILERACNSSKGTMTSFFSVLLEEDEGLDPIGEAVKSILDGHIILSKDLFMRGRFPAIDVVSSVSRLMNKVVDDKHAKSALKMRSWIGAYESVKELLDFGAYVRGENRLADEALDKMDDINAFLSQDEKEDYDYDKMLEALYIITGEMEQRQKKKSLSSLL